MKEIPNGHLVGSVLVVCERERESKRERKRERKRSVDEEIHCKRLAVGCKAKYCVPSSSLPQILRSI